MSSEFVNVGAKEMSWRRKNSTEGEDVRMDEATIGQGKLNT